MTLTPSAFGSDPSSGLPKALLLGTFGAIVGLWVGSLFAITGALSNWEDRGLFGDSFGAVNSLFSGLAFAGVILTIYLQRLELALQREELRCTRTELERTASAQEDSHRALLRQADVMAATARLTALTSLVDHHRLELEHTGSVIARDRIIQEQLDHLAQLKRELSLLSMSYPPSE